MTFSSLFLHPNILKAIEEAGFTVPTDIQSAAIPAAMEGQDIKASAQTGTGKTAAFLLPTLHRLLSNERKKGQGPRALILAPTRELAMQITQQAETFSQHARHIKTVCISGGVPYHTQQRKLSRPYDILVATPGRLIDFIERRKINLSQLETLVLDEADRMLDMGFIEPVERIVSLTPDTRQTLLFSATLRGKVLTLAERLLTNPCEIVIHAERAKHENISQRLYYSDDLYHKNRLLDHLLRGEEVDNTIIFTSTKRHADQLVDELFDLGHHAAALHGDMSQRQRTRTIQQLRNGRVKILVATDVAARGIDVPTITHVINFDLPRNIEDYVHRIGRTGRAGAMGTAISFAGGRESFLVKRIEEFTGQDISVAEIEGLEPRSKQRSPRPAKRPRFQAKGKERFGRPPHKEGGRPGRFGQGGRAGGGRFSQGGRPGASTGGGRGRRPRKVEA